MGLACGTGPFLPVIRLPRIKSFRRLKLCPIGSGRLRRMSRSDCAERTCRGKGVPMKALLGKTREFLRSESGPTATEYAIMLALIAMFAVAAFGQFGLRVSGIYSVVDGTMPDI